MKVVDQTFEDEEHDQLVKVYITFELVIALSGLATGLVLTVATRGRLAYHQDEP